MQRVNGKPAQPVVSILVAPDSEADSVEEQDYPALEVVRLKRDPAAGILEALDWGLQQTAGELVGYLGPGERLLPGAVAALSRALLSQSAVAVAYPTFHRIDGSGKTIETVAPDEFDSWEILRLQHCPVGPAPMFRREAALKAVRPEPDFRHCRELVFWLQISKMGALRRLNAPLASRRTSGEKRTRGGLGAAHERIRLLERFISEAELPTDSNQAAQSAARNAFIAAAAEIEPGLNNPEERFFIADRFAGDWPDPEGLDPDAGLALLEARYANLDRRLTRQQAVFQVLEAAVEKRETVLSQPNGFSREERRWSMRRLARRLREDSSGS